MEDNSIESGITELFNLRRDPRMRSPMKEVVSRLLLDLRFLALYAQCLTKSNEALQDRKNRHLRQPKILGVKATLEGATRGLYTAGVEALQTQDWREWETLAETLRGKVDLCKPKIREDCLDFLVCAFQYKFTIFELEKFYRSLSDTLSEFVLLKSDNIGDHKGQIQRIKGRLQLFIEISEFNPSTVDSSNKDVKDFKIVIQTWLHNAACLSLLYWIAQGEGGEEETEFRMDIFLSTPEMTRMFLSVLKSLWLSLQNRLLMYEGVFQFADFCLEIFQHNKLDQEYQETDLRIKLIYLTAFLVDPPLTKGVESISREVKSLICSLGANKTIEPTSFLGKMNGVTEKVTKLNVHIFKDSSSFDFPGTNVLGLLDSVLENLQGISDLSRKDDLVIVQQELLWLRGRLGAKIMQLQTENHDIKDLWTQIVNFVYRAKIVMHLLLYADDPVGYNAKCLSDITDEFNLLKSDIDKIQHLETSNIEEPAEERATSLSRHDMAEISKEFVGFVDQEEAIVDKLTVGSKDLKIVSVFGMAGQGKTTLARKIYDKPIVQEHFNKRAWCCVSETYQTKKLMIEILGGIVPDVDFSAVPEENLPEILHQNLSGYSYLIVMDDVWDASAWRVLKDSFPKQLHGSRILFTSRKEKVASEADEGAILHPLRPLRPDESLELLKMKLFGEADFPKNLLDVPIQIVEGCNGLPLSLVVIAGILKKNVYDLKWWNHIAGSIDKEASDNCMSVVELSYKHLQEFLKPCFLYFGTFQEDRAIRVRKLIQLWISEGFVQKSNGEELEDVAKDYLEELVACSLVFVTRQSSGGRIKTCNVHDLLREFCLKKGKKENFFQLERLSGEPSGHPAGASFKTYRICIQTGVDVFFASNPSGACVHSLLFLPDYSFYMNDWEFFSIGNFKLLGVLDLEEIEFDGNFPGEVVLLVLLKYLAIWCPHGSLSIPPSIANLRILETFRVKRYSRFGNEVYLPNAIWKMKSLRNIDVGVAAFSDDGGPEEESSTLDNVRTFSSPSLCFGEAAEKLLKRLPNVRKLRCQFDDLSEEFNDQFPSLDSDDSVLRSLNVVYIGKLFPRCPLNFPQTLKKLTLSDFKLPWDYISAIGMLPELEVLKLLENAFEGPIWEVSDDEFQKLKFLKLCNLNIENWCAELPFPLLKEVIVEDCYNLQAIPSEFEDSVSLKRIEVRWCNPEVASSAKEVQKRLFKGRGNEIKVTVL